MAIASHTPSTTPRAGTSHGRLAARLSQLGAQSYDAILREPLVASIGAVPRVFEGLEPEETFHFTKRSHVIDCRRGDVVIEAGESSRTIYIVLDGALEVRSGERLLSVLRQGDVFGEFALLLNAPRTADVYAASETARVVGISEKTITELTKSQPELAARVLFNLARVLAHRIVEGG